MMIMIYYFFFVMLVTFLLLLVVPVVIRESWADMFLNRDICAPLNLQNDLGDYLPGREEITSIPGFDLTPSISSNDVLAWEQLGGRQRRFHGRRAGIKTEGIEFSVCELTFTFSFLFSFISFILFCASVCVWARGISSGINVAEAK